MNMQKEAHFPMVPAFLIKTYQLVDDASTNHIVSWGEGHTTFVVWSPSEMARLVLPCFFKHSNFSSFVRQLNLYGFRKVAVDRWEFANEFFRKGAKHLLCKIQRQKTENAPSSGAPSKNSADDQHCCVCNDMIPFTPSLSSSSPRISPVEEAISPVDEVLGSPTLDISSENERWDHVKLLSELTRIRHLYEESLCIIQQQNPVKEANGAQKSLSKACQCQHFQHQRIVKFPFKVPEESVRKESFGNNTRFSFLENRDVNRLSMSSIQDLQMDSTRENRDKSDTSMKSAYATCVCNDMRSVIPSSQSPTMASACVEVGREPLSLLLENNRLRRDNAILLSELTHVRKLYNEALSIIEIQKSHLEEANHRQQHPSSLKIMDSQSRDMQVPFIDSLAASRTDIMQHKRDFTDSPSCNNDVYHDAKKLRGCQDACERTPQLATIDNIGEKISSKQSVNEEIKGPIRLFGVPLQCSKKRQHKEDICSLNVIGNTHTNDDDDDELMIIKVVTEDRAFEKMPSLKSITVDSLEEIQ